MNKKPQPQPRSIVRDRDVRGRDEWWVDWLEDELDSSLENDLALFLSNSSPDQYRLQQFNFLRERIKRSDDVPLPESGVFYQDLHDRIMAGIDGRRPRPPAKYLSRVSPRQLGFPALFSTSTLAVLIAGLLFLNWNSDHRVRPQAADRTKTVEQVVRHSLTEERLRRFRDEHSEFSEMIEVSSAQERRSQDFRLSTPPSSSSSR